MANAAVKYVYQPPGSSLCGQACVAMVGNIDLEEACKLIGHRHSTKTRELVRALKTLGIKCDEKLRRVGKSSPIPLRAIVMVRFPGRSRAHWEVVWGRWFDPDLSGEVNNGKPTSFLEIFDQETKP